VITADTWFFIPTVILDIVGAVAYVTENKIKNEERKKKKYCHLLIIVRLYKYKGKIANLFKKTGIIQINVTKTEKHKNLRYSLQSF
jgi:hypothetical protein